MAAAQVARLEGDIRLKAQTKRVRVKDFFYDFDKLRSGYVTNNQFFRTLWTSLGIKVTEEDEHLLSQKYDFHANGRFNYQAFCNAIEEHFDANAVHQPPEQQTTNNDEYFGTLRTCRPLSAEAEGNLRTLLLRLQQHYNNQGHNLRAVYRDFDRHNNGLVTESQFYRALPKPGDMTEAEIALLIRKYKDPEKEGLVNYQNLQNDMITLLTMEKARAEGIPSHTLQDQCRPPTQQKVSDPSVQMILDRLSIAVHKNGVRVLEFFRDYDKLRHDLVTENQFCCAISLALGKEAQLTRAEIQRLANFYRADKDRVHYREFCSLVDAPFTIQHLDKQPTLEPVAPLRGTLSRGLAPLTMDEEQKVEHILGEIRNQVRQRRIMMYQYFKDYDRSMAYTRVMTANQFARMLHFLSVNVSPEDLNLLARKFADPFTGDVNYPAFVQLVDEQFKAQTTEEPIPDDVLAKLTTKRENTAPVTISVGDDVPLETLMARIRHIVLTNRLRIKTFFEDFDQLRCGRMTKSQFRRCLAQIGLSKLGEHDLSDAQAARLMEYYTDPQNPDKVFWIRFVDDVDSVFTAVDLEQNPLAQISSPELYLVPKPGTTDWASATADHKELYDAAVSRMRQKVSERRMLVKPTFRDFDKHNNGHISRNQFRQVLTITGLTGDEAEMQAIEARFANDKGFHYAAFLEDLEPTIDPDFMYVKRLEELRHVNARGRLPEMISATDFEQVMQKVKTKVYRGRLRLHEFLRDHDKLRSGCMKKVTFRRALDQATLALTETELSLLEDRFTSPYNPEKVEWMRFVDEVEAIFTQKNMEKEPMADPDQFQPEAEAVGEAMSPEETEMVNEALAKLAEQVRQRRIQLFPLFEDFDRCRTGNVPQNQFRRVLASLDLACGLAELEWALLYKRFGQNLGSRYDVNYMAFADHVYHMCGFEHRKP